MFNAEDAAGFVGKYALQPTTRTAGILMTTPLGKGGSISLDAAHGRRAESDYTQVNARVAYPWRGVRFVLDARNLTDAEYLDPSAKPVAGRAAYITLEWGRK